MANREEALVDAVLACDLDRVRELCEAGADPTRVPSGGYRSALQYAMWRTSLEVTEYLVSRPGLDLNARADDGRTALHFVESDPAGQAVTRLLVERGADVNAANESGETPLFAMVTSNDLSAGVERFDYLVAHGADPAHRNNSGQTVLDVALASTWPDEFPEVSDKPGFLRLLRHMLDLGLPHDGFGMRDFAAWLADKQAKYLDGVAPQPVSSPARERFTAVFQPGLAFVGRRATLIVDGSVEAVTIFDWYTLQDEEEDDEHDYATQIWDYHIDPDVAQARVEAQEWIPFGVVGLLDGGEGFEEIGARGTLYLDMTRATDADAPVAHVQSEPRAQSLIVSFRELIATADYAEGDD
jgi:Ankyrin repeats (3 copies)